MSFWRSKPTMPQSHLQQRRQDFQQCLPTEHEQDRTPALDPSSRNSRNISNNIRGTTVAAGRRRGGGGGGGGGDLHQAPVSSSSSISGNPASCSLTSLNLNCASLAGQRVDPNTPVLGWKTSNTNHFQYAISSNAAKHQQLPVSARKLAATFWELHDIPFQKASLMNKIRATVTPQHQHQQLDQLNSSCKRTRQLPQNSSPASSSVGQRVHKRYSIQHKFREGARRHRHSGGQPAWVYPQVVKLLERQNGAGTQELISPSDNEIEAGNRAITPSNSMLDMEAIPGYSDSGATTSSELLKVLNRIWNLEEQHNSSMSLVSALHTELEHARAQVQKLLQEQKLHHNEIDDLKKRLADERIMWQEQERETIKATVHSIMSELENEKRAKCRLEMLHKKVIRDMAELKTTLDKALQSLERERTARELMEDVCDELAREIGEDKAEAEELKRESAKVREEVEEERQMLQMAEVWREERVQMKLAEARLELKEKNAVVDKLRNELKVFLRAKRASDVKSEGIRVIDKHLERCRSSVDSIYLHEARNAALDSTCSSYPKEKNSHRSSVKSVFLNGKRDIAHGVQELDNDSADDDLHSIELNNGSFISNIGSSHWSYLQQEVGRTVDRRGPAVDYVEKEKHCQSGKVQKLERSRSSQVDPGIVAVENKEKSEHYDYANNLQWIDRTFEKGELCRWSPVKQFPPVVNIEVNPDWQSDQEELQDPPGRNFQGQADIKTGNIPVEVTSSRHEASTYDSYTNHPASRFRSIGRAMDLQKNSGFTPVQQSLHATSSPTHHWNHYWSSPDPSSPHRGKTNKGLTDMAMVRDNSLKSKLLEAKLEGQRARLRAAKGL